MRKLLRTKQHATVCRHQSVGWGLVLPAAGPCQPMAWRGRPALTHDFRKEAVHVLLALSNHVRHQVHNPFGFLGLCGVRARVLGNQLERPAALPAAFAGDVHGRQQRA
jgi:hypothetical protein